MICRPCADEADGGLFFAQAPICRSCMCNVSTYHTPTGQARVEPHYTEDGFICQGSRRTPHWVGGHASCQGCDCMHKPKGAWRGGAVHE